MALSTPVDEIVKQSSDPLLSKHHSWERVLLEELSEVLNGAAFKSSRFNKERGMPLIRIRDVGKGSTEVLYDGPHEERYVVEAGDLLIGMDGDFNSARWKDSSALLNQRVCKVELKSNHYFPGFLEYVLPGYLKAINGKTSAVTVKHLSSKSVKEIPLPLPPLNEQRRIVEKIEELFTKLDAGVRSLEQARAQLKSYRRSVLKAAVEGELSRGWREAHRDELEPASELLDRILQERREKFTGKKYKEPDSPDTSEMPDLPEGWEWTNLDQLAYVIGGLTKNRKRDAHPLQLPYLRVANVYANELRLDDVEEIGVEDSELSRLLLQSDDLLVVEGNGSPDQIGRVALWSGSINPCVHQNHLIKVRFFQTSISRYALYWLLSSKGREHIKRVASSTSGLYTLSLSKVKALPVPLAPLEEQHFIVEEVERRLSVVDKLEATAEENLKQATGLRQSILKQAFSGELVPQNPDDEPASVLLERIREERMKSASPKKRRKKPARAEGKEAQVGLF